MEKTKNLKTEKNLISSLTMSNIPSKIPATPQPDIGAVGERCKNGPVKLVDQEAMRQFDKVNAIEPTPTFVSTSSIPTQIATRR